MLSDALPGTVTALPDIQNYRQSLIADFDRRPLKVRYRSYQALSHRAEEQVLADLNRSVGGMAELNSEGEFVRVNEEYAKLFNTSTEDMTGKTWRSFIAPTDQLLADKAYETMQKNGRAEVQLKALRPDGTTFWENAVLVKYEDAVALFSGHVRFSRDVTPEIEAKVDVQEMNDLLQGLCDHALNPIIVVDAAFKMAYRWGQRAQDFFNHAEIELRGRRLYDVLFSAETVEQFLKDWNYQKSSGAKSFLLQGNWDLVSREGLVKRSLRVIPCELYRRTCYTIEIQN